MTNVAGESNSSGNGCRRRGRPRDRVPKPPEDRGALIGALAELMGRLPLVNLSGRLALRPQEAADALGISERKLRELLPELPHVRRKGVLLFPLEGLRTWLAAESSTENVDANAAKSLADRVLEDLGR